MKANKATADELLDKGSDFYDKGIWNQALECWERAYEIYEGLGDKLRISNTLNNIGIVYFNRGEWVRALEYYEKSLTISEELGDKLSISNILSNIGIVYLNRGEWERALEYYEKSLTISEELGHKPGIPIALGNIGEVYRNKGEWGRALEYYEKSLTISEELGNKLSISNILSNIGIVYLNRGEWGQALEYYEKSLTISKELGDKPGITNTLSNIGKVYRNKGKWVQALEYYEKSLKISEELCHKQWISTALSNIGDINIKHGDLDEAKINLEKSLAIAEELAPISTVAALVNLSKLWKLDDRYDDAFATLEKALQIVKDTGAKPEEIEILEKLADTYMSKYIADKEEKNLSSAEKFYKKALELARSLKMPLQEATATLGYARALYENNDIVEAELAAKSAAFDALRNDYREPLVKTYLLLGDIAMSQENQYGYYLDCLKEAEFNPKIYVKTCFFLIFRMKKMKKQVLVKFISTLKEITKTKSFDKFLNALNARIDGKKPDTAGLPSSLVEELESFRL